MFFRLSSWEVGAHPAGGRPRHDRDRPRSRPLPAAPVRASPGALRRSAGCAPRPGRARPRLRPRPRGGTVRGPPHRSRRRGERDRHDLPASPDSARADPHAVARTPRALHGHDHRHFERGSGQRSRSGRPRPRATGCSESSGALAGQELDEAPVASAPRLYVESLNEMFDAETTRIGALDNRVPGAVLAVEVGGAAVALALLAFYLAILGRGVATVMLAAGLITRALARHVRPRPADARSHPGSGHAARQPARLDGAATGGERTRAVARRPVGGRK